MGRGGERIRSERLERSPGRSTTEDSAFTVHVLGESPPDPLLSLPAVAFLPAVPADGPDGAPRARRPGVAPICPERHKRTQLVPMRFVMVCEKGRFSDVPWDYWAHSTAVTANQKQCDAEES